MGGMGGLVVVGSQSSRATEMCYSEMAQKRAAAQDMRKEGQVGRWQAGVPVLQATFVPGQALVLAAAGGDGAVHLLDLGSTLCKLPPLLFNSSLPLPSRPPLLPPSHHFTH